MVKGNISVRARRVVGEQILRVLGQRPGEILCVLKEELRIELKSQIN